MAEFQHREFGYATSKEELEWIDAKVSRPYTKHGMAPHHIGAGYGFYDRPGELTEFYRMIELSGQEGHTGDTLFISGMSLFSLFSFSQVYEMITELERIEMEVKAAGDVGFHFRSFAEGVKLAAEGLPEYRASQDAHTAAYLCRAGHPLDDVCKFMGLSRSAVLRAMASCEEEHENGVVEEAADDEEVLTTEVEDAK